MTQMVPMSALQIDGMVAESDVYKRLRALNIPHEFAHEIGRMDIMMAMAIKSVMAQTAATIDAKVAEVRLDSYLDDQNQDVRTSREITAVGLVTTGFNQPQAPVVSAPALTTPALPPAPSTTQPFTKTFTILPALVGTVSASDPIGLNNSGLAIVADANQYLGPAKSVSGNQVEVYLTAPIVTMPPGGPYVPGNVYYSQAPGDPHTLLLYAALTVGSVARGRYYATSATEGMLLSWEPFEKSP